MLAFSGLGVFGLEIWPFYARSHVQEKERVFVIHTMYSFYTHQDPVG